MRQGLKISLPEWSSGDSAKSGGSCFSSFAGVVQVGMKDTGPCQENLIPGCNMPMRDLYQQAQSDMATIVSNTAIHDEGEGSSRAHSGFVAATCIASSLAKPCQKHTTFRQAS